MHHQLTIDEIRQETMDFKTIVFKEGHNLSYEAGQFITLVDNSGLQEIRRSYSIVSSPVLNEPLAIGVKRIDNGFFSRILTDKTRKGDNLLTSGVGGFFRLPENINSFTSIFFFAAGSGITPILSLIKTTLHLYPEVSVFLIYSNRSPETTAYYALLKQMERQFPDQLVVHFLFSSAADLKKARLNRDLLLEMITMDAFDRNKTMIYTCGPEAYMRLIIFLLLEEGFPKEQIKKEDFNPGNKKLPPKIPPDTKSYMVELEITGTRFEIQVTYPDSILQAGLKRKLDLPYSCETGKCGSCAAHCLSGKIWLSNNEVLTDLDLANGLTLTCTGHPQSADVVLKID
jgi:ferredoxin-NADP reductase